MQRLYFVQWLRVFLISLVVAHHAGQPYGPTGGAWPIDDPANTEWLGPFFGVNAAFFMGFFFLIAGYFTGSSYDRKGGAAFVRDRLVRLGIPLVFVTLFLFGPISYLSLAPAEGFFQFFFGTYLGRWQIDMGHLWFVAQLLAYSLIYAIFRAALARRGARDNRALPVPGDGSILVYAITLALVGALVRTVYPQDAWVRLLWLVPAEPAHLPQYASLFVVGIVAGRGDWFVRLPAMLGVRWFAVGVAAFLAAGYARANLPVDFEIVWGIAEAFICVGLILGLTVLFRRYCAKPGRWLERLDGNVYGVYIVHVFILVALQGAIVGMDWPATAKFLATFVAGLVLSFLMVAALRTIPAVRRVV